MLFTRHWHIQSFRYGRSTGFPPLSDSFKSFSINENPTKFQHVIVALKIIPVTNDHKSVSHINQTCLYKAPGLFSFFFCTHLSNDSFTEQKPSDVSGVRGELITPRCLFFSFCARVLRHCWWLSSHTSSYTLCGCRINKGFIWNSSRWSFKGRPNLWESEWQNEVHLWVTFTDYLNARSVLHSPFRPPQKKNIHNVTQGWKAT